MSETAPSQSEAILEAIKVRKKELIAELNELETAERVYKSLHRKNGEHGRLHQALAAVPEGSLDSNLDSTRRRRPSLVLGRGEIEGAEDDSFNKTMRQATLEILASVSERGMSANSLKASLENLGWKRVKSTSLASLLTRLKNEGVVDNLNRRWMLSQDARTRPEA
jgi:DNA-binding HxlR family transcriptional regulator